MAKCLFGKRKHLNRIRKLKFATKTSFFRGYFSLSKLQNELQIFFREQMWKFQAINFSIAPAAVAY